MYKRPTVSKLAEEAIKELALDNIICTPNEILYLHELGDLASRPDDFKLLDYCYTQYGNLKIYPITIGAKVWLQEIIKDFPFDETFMQFALIYAYSHSRNPSAFNFDTVTDCKKTILKFCKSLKVTELEWNNVIDSVTINALEGKKKAHEDEGGCSVIPALSLLVNNFGKDKQYWLWQVSEDECLKWIHEAIKLMAQKQGATGKIDIDDKSLLAFSTLKKAINEIRQSRKQNIAEEKHE